MPYGPHLGARASCSSRTTHQTSPRKITTSSIVDSPDTLNRQNNSVPSSKPAESQATPGSNKRRARKKTSVMTARNRS